MEKRLSIGLFEPGMSHLHRVGLAGLYMSLKYFDANGRTCSEGKWKLEKDRVTLSWQGTDKNFFEELFTMSFKSDNHGFIDFAAHRSFNLGDLKKVFLNRALLKTFLQHNKQNKIPKNVSSDISISLEQESINISYKPFVKGYAHSLAVQAIADDNGQLRNSVGIKGWLYPGGIQRHEKASNSQLEEPLNRFIALLYAPMAAVYFDINHKGYDAKKDQRYSVAVVLPHINDLESYAECYKNYLGAPVEKLSVDGLGDAGLNTLLLLRTSEKVGELETSGCSIVVMGTAKWSGQQKTKTAVHSFENIDEQCLSLFEIAYRNLPNKIIPTKAADNYYTNTKLSRGLIADNLAQGKDWLSGFYKLMLSKERAKIINNYEREGLNKMIRENVWTSEADKQFVKAIHVAIRNRYGALADKSKFGEKPNFEREFERMRTGLVRSKNVQTLRFELADIFTRGGRNFELRANWQELLPLFAGRDWQRARDLALFALASYPYSKQEDDESTQNQHQKEKKGE